MRIAITQPTYVPWLGYFDLIDQVDQFVLLDNVQFEKQSWQQRNRIKTPSGLQWLTVPVVFRGRLGQQIKDVEIREPDFARDHLRAVELSYRRSPFFDEYYPRFQNLLQSCKPGNRLVDLNVSLITWLLEVLGISTTMVRSSELPVEGKRTALLADICRVLRAEVYLSPLGSAVYLLDEIAVMSDQNVQILFQNYEHPVYQQMFPPFQPFASVLDLIFNNEGERSLEIIRSGRRKAFHPDEAMVRLNEGAKA